MRDANDTPFKHLLTAADWSDEPDAGQAEAALKAAGLSWSSRDGSLGLKPKLYRFPTPEGAEAPDFGDRRGAARDEYGHSFWIGEDERRIRMRPRDAEPFDWWPVRKGVAPQLPKGAFHPLEKDPEPPELVFSGLCITTKHVLAVGVRAPWTGLLLFDLHAGGPALKLCWADEIGFHPVDLAADSDGGLWILDRPDPATARLWAMDRNHRLIPLPAPEDPAGAGAGDDGSAGADSARGLFSPEGENPAPCPERPFPDALVLPAMPGALAIESLPDRSVLIMESDTAVRHSVIYRYVCEVQEGKPKKGHMAGKVSLDAGIFDDLLADTATDSDEIEAAGLLGLEFLHRPSPDGDGQLYVVGPLGNQVFAFDLYLTDGSFELKLRKEDYFPLYRFGGKALVENADGTYYDSGERWLPLVPQRRPRFTESGIALPRALDSETHDCPWHRVLLDARIPPGTGVTIESRAANERAGLQTEPWQTEPAPYLRHAGAEIPGHAPFGELPCEGSGTWDLLLQNPRGRWLQLRVTLMGTGQQTPRIRSLRAYGPRFSYLDRYLPAVYREDAASASFLERYLANTEGMLTTWEDRIAAAQILFDASTAPEDYLDWLAGWLGVVLDPTWETWRRRLFLRHAAELFRQRGTVTGLLRALRLAIDDAPDDGLFEEDPTSGVQQVQVVESFQQRGAPGRLFAGDGDAGVRVGEVPDWTPAQGPGALDTAFERWARSSVEVPDANADGGTDDDDHLDYWGLEQWRFPALRPENAAKAAHWRRFVSQQLGFTYAEADASHLGSWRDFLIRRYRGVPAISRAHGEDYRTLEDIPLPERLPAGAKALEDWIRFVAVRLPTDQHSHRFRVSVPAPGDARDATAITEFFRRVEQVVDASKPAHTDFEIELLAGLFRVGAARLGLDTLVEHRVRERRIALGFAVLGEGSLTTIHPYNLTNRIVLERSGTCAAGGTGIPYLPGRPIAPMKEETRQ